MTETSPSTPSDPVQHLSADLFERGLRVIPGGVNSPVRAFRSVGGVPYFVERGEGCWVYDVDGNRFVDYVQSYGASILGHAAPSVVAAVAAAAQHGTTFGAPTRGEVELAEELVGRVAGLEQVRLVSSGTEAVMSAVRVARGATGRSTIVKFAGHYHGHSDALLAAGGSGVAQQGLAGSDGVTAGAVADTIVVDWNQPPVLDETVAAVVVEPFAANMGLVPPRDGFLEELAESCRRVGALLIFDEVITGFRVDRGGASTKVGVTPDMWTFGKVIGGGLPVGAFGGSEELMSHLAPLGGVYQAGTLSGNPLATAAGLAVLRQLDDGAYERLAKTALAVATILRDAFAAAGVPAVVPVVGPLVGLFFGEHTPQDYGDAQSSVALGWYPTFFWGMLRRGVALAPGAYEVMFPSLSHGDEALTVTAAAATAAALDVAREAQR